MIANLPSNILLPFHRTGSTTVTQIFGNANTLYPRGYHAGVDLGYNMRTPLYAPCHGKIVVAQWENPNDHTEGYGQYVGIQSDGYIGFRIFVCHLDEINVCVGQIVDWNTLIGYSGNSGHSEGAHSHIQFQAEDTWDGKYAIPPFYHKLIGATYLPVVYNKGDIIQGVSM